MIRKFFAVGLMLVLSACATPQMGTSANLQLVNSDTFPSPDRADLVANERTYLIGPFDKLEIDVFGVEELSKKEVQTDASGRISFPFAGTIEASGKTPAEVSKMIQLRLARYIRDPQVTVNLKETVSQVITVDGAVREPGLYPVVGKMTLLRAIATAKGMTDIARDQNVIVFRTVNGNKLAALFNLKAIRRGNYPDPEVYANDVVVVDESTAKKIFKDVLQVAPTLAYALVTLVR
ncbi:MAG: polysaccharide export protein [Acidobacteria bacterium]|nr:polysaccharide export protein [Acidobacteriota bacterium]